MEKFSIAKTDFVDVKVYFKQALIFHTFGNFRNTKEIKEIAFESVPYEYSYKKLGFEIENKTKNKIAYFNAYDN